MEDGGRWKWRVRRSTGLRLRECAGLVGGLSVVVVVDGFEEGAFGERTVVKLL